MLCYFTIKKEVQKSNVWVKIGDFTDTIVAQHKGTKYQFFLSNKTGKGLSLGGCSQLSSEYLTLFSVSITWKV